MMLLMRFFLSWTLQKEVCPGCQAINPFKREANHHFSTKMASDPALEKLFFGSCSCEQKNLLITVYQNNANAQFCTVSKSEK